MKINAIIVFILVGCSPQQPKSKTANYNEVYKALTKDGAFRLFKGVNIVPRDGVDLDPNLEDYYLIMLCYPTIQFYGDPVKPSKDEIAKLIDSLSRSNPATSQLRADSIILRMQNQVFFMKRYGIRAVTGSTCDEFQNSFWDFYLSQTEYIRYIVKRDSKSNDFPDNIIKVLWIDSSLAYCRTKPPYEK